MAKHRRLLIAVAALLALSVSAASAIQPGTTGTEKRFQEQGLRSGVLIQKNNTATATGGAATLNAAGSGIITSEALTTPSASEYTLTLTNNMVEAGDIVMATVQNGTNTGGEPSITAVTPGSGQVVIKVKNVAGGTNPFNGTVKIGFTVIKQSANGSD